VYYSVRNFLAEEVLRRGMLVNRDTITSVANNLRREHGSDYVTKQLFVRALKEKSNVVIESIRTVGEVECLRTHQAKLWAVDADVKQRYVRILHMPDMSHLTFEQFVEKEKQDLSSKDPLQSNLAEVQALADVTILNNGTREELYQQIEKNLPA
jgi:dephospho-CoA kinase